MSPVNDGWELSFKDGTSAMADIVVGADGANSKIRPFITPIQPFYCGVTAVEGNVYDAENATPRINELLRGGKIFAFADSKNLIVSSKGDGSLPFYLSCKKDENWMADSGINFADTMQVTSWFRKEFSGWDDIWLELFLNAQAPFIPRPIYSMPLDQSWDALPNMTILGDAAHLMPPYAGEGVNMAMLDALELSECLFNNEFPDVQSAIAAYELQMLKRASEATRASLENTEWMHAEQALNNMLAMFGQ